MREYVVLKEHKGSTTDPITEPHLVVVGVVKAHDQEAAIKAVHEAEVLPADQKAQSNIAYRAVPLTYYEPLIVVKRVVVTNTEFVRSTKPIARPKRQPKQSPALPLEQKTPEAIAADVTGPALEGLDAMREGAAAAGVAL